MTQLLLYDKIILYIIFTFYVACDIITKKSKLVLRKDKIMTAGLIEIAKNYVKEKFENEFSGHDYFHSLRVFNMATRIAMAEGANLEIVQLSALLHDVDDRKTSPETHENQANARGFLAANGIDGETIELICQIIREISFGSNNERPTTLEGQCVQDADRLDAIGAIGIGRAFAYGGNHNRHMYHPDVPPNLNMTKDEYRKSESTTINHFYEKLFKLTALMNTSTALQIAKEREEYMKNFVSTFLDEWDGLK